MKIIDFSGDIHRKKHFDFFRSMDQPHFNICAPIEIDPLLDFIKKEQIPFTAMMVYIVSRVANSIDAFRQRIRGEQVVEHSKVHPSFTVKTEASSVFSFCYVDYTSDLRQFAQQAQEAIAAMQIQPSFEDEANRDDFLYISALPWIRFTSLQHAMHYDPVDSVPRRAWGKYYKEGGLTKIPLSVQAHHALVDGIHMGEYFTRFQENCLNPRIFWAGT